MVKFKGIRNLKTRYFLSKIHVRYKTRRNIKSSKEYFRYKCWKCKEFFFSNIKLQYSEQICEECEKGKKKQYGHYLGLRFKVFKRDGFRCIYCGRTVKEHGTTLQVDHIIPRSKGGSNDFGNLITACFECNQGKKCVLLEQRDIKKLKNEGIS